MNVGTTVINAIATAAPVCETDDSLQTPVIFAPVSPPGISGVAVYRFSGANLAGIFSAFGLSMHLTPRQAHLVTLSRAAQDGQRIDQALALYFPAPHSFTGEHVLELHTHGGIAIRSQLLDYVATLPGCRLAMPGEFSRRAVMNGKMDLLQAEAIADLIEAETLSQHQLALGQLDGSTSAVFETLRGQMLHALALLEALIDFPEEEIPPEVSEKVTSEVSQLKQHIAGLIAHAHVGQRMRSGISVALIGPPNVGKSSLLNALAQREIAIVSPIAGTTRDRIETHLNLGGQLMRLMDTAGLREASDSIEREGIARTQQAIEEADILLHVRDITHTEQKMAPLAIMHQKLVLTLYNKIDLCQTAPLEKESDSDVLYCSTKSGDGLPELILRLGQMAQQLLPKHTNALVTRERHRQHLQASLQALEHFSIHAPIECACEDLRQAAFSLGQITGIITNDEVLGAIFSEFCIGK